MMKRTSLVWCALTVGAVPCLAGETPKPAYTAVRTPGPIRVDGRFDEPSWQRAPVSTDFQWLSQRVRRGHAKTPARTHFRILVDDEAVYLGIRCAEPMMDKLRFAPMGRNGNVWSRDCVEIFIAPTGRNFSFYQFVVTAGNDVWNGSYIEKGNTSAGPYDAMWTSAVHRGRDFWSLEVRFPLSAFHYTPSADFASTWLLNVTRQRKPAHELSTWSPLRFGFLEPDGFNYVGGMPPKPAKYDLQVTDTQAELSEATGAGYRGRLVLSTWATQTTAGAYQCSVWQDGKPLVTRRPVRVSAGKGQLAVPDVTFPGLGKVLLKLVLERDGEPRTGLYVQPRLAYEPITIDVTEPFYARCIFPGQVVPQITGTVTVHLPPDRLEGAVLDVSLTGRGAPKPTRVALDGNRASFKLEAAKLRVGNYTLKATVARDGKTLAETSLLVRKLARPKGSCVWIDRELNLVKDGRPMFVRHWGGAFSVSYAIWQKYSQPKGDFVNAYNCAVCMACERIDRAERDRCKQDVVPSKKVFDTMRKRIQDNRINADLLWYYLADEPECRGLSPVYLKHQYEFIKQHDPYHPVMIISRAPATYVGCADVLSPHPYLNPRITEGGKRAMRSPKAIRDQMRTVLKAGKGRIPAWCTPQAFSYAFIDPHAQYPTFREFRCMVYTAVVNGCKGLYPFGHSSHFASMDLRLGVPFVFETLGCLEWFLVAPGSPVPVQVDAPDDGVDVWIKRVDGRTLVIAVNLLDRPVDARIRSTGLAGIGTLLGVRERTAVRVTGAELTLRFTPYEVHILSDARVAPANGDGAMTVGECQTLIDRSNAALKKPGNLLFGRGREITFTSSDTYMHLTTSLVDGVCDALGFRQIIPRVMPAWVEMRFRTFTPTFRCAKLYTGGVTSDLELLALRDGKWHPLAKVTDHRGPVVTFRFDKPLTAAGLRIVMSKLAPKADWRGGWGKGKAPELYEVELYK